MCALFAVTRSSTKSKTRAWDILRTLLAIAAVAGSICAQPGTSFAVAQRTAADRIGSVDKNDRLDRKNAYRPAAPPQLATVSRIAPEMPNSRMQTVDRPERSSETRSGNAPLPLGKTPANRGHMPLSGQFEGSANGPIGKPGFDADNGPIAGGIEKPFAGPFGKPMGNYSPGRPIPPFRPPHYERPVMPPHRERDKWTKYSEYRDRRHPHHAWFRWRFEWPERIVYYEPSYTVAFPVYVEPFRAFDVRIWTDSGAYAMGNAIRVSYRSTHNAYVYIFDTDAAGVTRQILPNYYDNDNFAQAGITYGIPDGYYSLAAIGPAGRERLEIVALSCRAPIPYYERCVAQYPYPIRPDGCAGLLRAVECDAAYVGGRIVVGPNVVVVGGPTRFVATARDSAYFDVYDDRAVTDSGLCRMTIETRPSDADVYLNGQYVGKGDRAYDLEMGYYEVRVARDGYRTETRTIHVENDRPSRIDFDLGRSGE